MSIDGSGVHCVCRRPWLGELVVGCEQCGIWYHPACLDPVEAERARAAASNDRQWHCPRCAQPKSFGENGHDGLSGASLVQDTVAGQERKPVLLHCLCRQRVEEWNGEPMVCCDGCKEWFHTDCIGMRSDVYNGAPCISSCCLLFCPLTRHLPSSQSYLSQVTTSGSATIALLMVKTVVM